MGKDPAVLFYTSDFLTGSADLDMTERGQYITLICLQHQHGRLSRKIIDLNISNISQAVLDKFSVDKNGFYYNKRLEFEIEKRKEHSRKQSQNAYKRWKKEGEQSQSQSICDGISQSNAKMMPLENENEIEIDNEIINNKLSINSNIDTINKTTIFDFVEVAFGRTLNPIEYELIKDWKNDELTQHAVKEAIGNNVRNIKYIQTILDNFKNAGIKTVADAIAESEKFKQNKTKSYSPKSQLESEREAIEKWGAKNG